MRHKGIIMIEDNGDPYNPASAAYVGDAAVKAEAREEQATDLIDRLATLLRKRCTTNGDYGWGIYANGEETDALRAADLFLSPDVPIQKCRYCRGDETATACECV
jgi:hypothetical protein